MIECTGKGLRFFYIVVRTRRNEVYNYDNNNKVKKT